MLTVVKIRHALCLKYGGECRRNKCVYLFNRNEYANLCGSIQYCVVNFSNGSC